MPLAVHRVPTNLLKLGILKPTHPTLHPQASSQKPRPIPPRLPANPPLHNPPNVSRKQAAKVPPHRDKPTIHELTWDKPFRTVLHMDIRQGGQPV